MTAGSATATPIAIVGMAGRFPGASSIGELGSRLASGSIAIRPVTDDELRADGVDPARRSEPGYVAMSAPIDEPGRFDAELFGYSPGDAVRTDPQHRLLLELAYAAAEHAGYDPRALPGTVGVYAGEGLATYLAAADAWDEVDRSWMSTMIGNDKDYLCTRVAHALGLRGPAVSIQSACSTSLVALHTAVNVIAVGDCDAAIVGGVNVRVPHRGGHVYKSGGALSPDGYCRPFDTDAAGTIFASGGAAILIKPLDAAVAAGDTVHAVIAGTAVNNDGPDKPSYASPSEAGLARVMSAALDRSGVTASDIDLVMAHATGTIVGDPIEVRAVAEALGPDASCELRSIKSCVGHLDAAAGITSLVAVVEALRRSEIAPQAGFEALHPALEPFADRLRVSTSAVPWSSDDGPRHALVNATGIGGTNASVVVAGLHTPLRSAPERAGPHVAGPDDEAATPNPGTVLQVVEVSAQTANGRDALLDRVGMEVDGAESSAEVAAIAATRRHGREVFAERGAIVVGGSETAVVRGTASSESVEVALLLTGQGSQFCGMGAHLARTHDVFADSLAAAITAVRDAGGPDLASVLAEPGSEAATQRLARTEITQPATFAVSYASALLLASRGVDPVALLGHSIGEWTAACLAGVVSLSDAARIVVERGRLMAARPTGAMLAVALDEDAARRLAMETGANAAGAMLEVAACNSGRSIVLAGPADLVTAAAAAARSAQVGHSVLATSHAFHSASMQPAADAFTAMLASIELRAPQRPILSCATGAWLTDEDAIDPRYWGRQIRSAVRFADGLELLRTEAGARGARVVAIEAGPGAALVGHARSVLGADGSAVASIGKTPGEAEDLALASALATIWCNGGHRPLGRDVDAPLRRVPTATYPFGGDVHWRPMVADRSRAASDGQSSSGPLARLRNALGRGGEPAQDRTTLEIVTAAFEEALGFSPVKPDDRYGDLGGTSLLAVGLVAAIGEAMSRDIGVDALAAAPTPRLLAEAIDRGDVGSRATDAGHIVALSAPTRRGPGDEAPPLVLFHAHGGNVLGYSALADLATGGDRSTFGVRALPGPDQPPSLAVMAQLYHERLVERFGDRPLHLAGWCFGGAMAFEIAGLRRAEGLPVGSVTMLATVHPHFPKVHGDLAADRSALARARVRLEVEVANISAAAPSDRRRYLADKVSRVSRRVLSRAESFAPRLARIASSPTASKRRALDALADYNTDLFWAHDPGTYDGDVTLIAASGLPEFAVGDVTLGWSDAIGGATTTHVVDALDGSLLVQPAVAEIATMVADTIAAGDGGLPMAAPVTDPAGI